MRTTAPVTRWVISRLDPQDVAMSTTDDEAASFMVSAASGSVSESGSTATFTVKLTSQPSSQVDIPVSVSDTTEARVSTDNGTTLTFTTENWNADHVVTVTGLNDNLSDGTQSYVIRLDADNSTGDTVGYNVLIPRMLRCRRPMMKRRASWCLRRAVR